MSDHIPADAIERLFERICAEEPLSHITRADIQKWVSLLESEGWRYRHPEPSEDEREALDRLIVEHDPDERHPDDQRRCLCGEVIGESDGVVVTTDPYGHLRDAILAAGFTRRPMPSREQVAETFCRINDGDEWDGEACSSCFEAAEAVLALFKGGER